MLYDHSGNANHGIINGATWSTPFSIDNPIVSRGLFFSEYGEGSSNNKYLEIYNGLLEPVYLDDYVILGNYNGNEWSETFTFDPGVVVQPGDVYVMTQQTNCSSK